MSFNWKEVKVMRIMTNQDENELIDSYLLEELEITIDIANLLIKKINISCRERVGKQHDEMRKLLNGLLIFKKDYEKWLAKQTKKKYLFLNKFQKLEKE